MHSKRFLFTLIVICGVVFAGCRNRTDTAEVVAVGDAYDIHVRSEGRSLIPLSPEGPFPKWGYSTQFRAQGAGKRVAIDGVVYKEYSIGKDLEMKSLANVFSTCVVRISEDAKRLIVQGQLSEERKYVFNPSGTYDGIKIERPKVVALSARDKIEDISGLYIRAQGHYEYPHPQHPGTGQFRAEGKTFVLMDYLGKDGDYEIVGQVYHNMGGLDFDGLGVSSCKRIPAK